MSTEVLVLDSPSQYENAYQIHFSDLRTEKKIQIIQQHLPFFSCSYVMCCRLFLSNASHVMLVAFYKTLFN